MIYEISIDTPKGKKYIGIYDSELNKVVKWVRRSDHFLWKHLAWGFDSEVLKDFANRDATIEVQEKDSNDIFTVDAKRWVSEGIQEDLGYGLQYFLPEKQFTKTNKYD